MMRTQIENARIWHINIIFPSCHVHFAWYAHSYTFSMHLWPILCITHDDWFYYLYVYLQAWWRHCLLLTCLLCAPCLWWYYDLALCSCLRHVICFSMPLICSHDIIAMISSSMLHLRTTSLHDLIPMIACLVASPMIHTSSFHAVDDNHLHALHMIVIAYHMIDLIASHMMNNCSCYHVECHSIFTTPCAHYDRIVLHLPHVFRHLLLFGVVNGSYAYHRPFVEHFMHACYELEVDAYSLVTHICISTSQLHIVPMIFLLVLD